jgi:PAP2 superfamily protein
MASCPIVAGGIGVQIKPKMGAYSRPALEPNSPSQWGWKPFAIRFGLTALALVIWFWTQSLIGLRGGMNVVIHDQMHQLTAPLNNYLQLHPSSANALLIVSSAMIDLFGIFLLARWLLGTSLRPFLALVILLGLRQIMQALVALPTPLGSIWHYPGFPSLLRTYGVSSDYFFSGHTAIAVLGARELAGFGRRWLTAIAVAVVLFEVAAVLVLRAHYTMDVFTGAVTAVYVSSVADWLVLALGKSRRATAITSKG